MYKKERFVIGIMLAIIGGTIMITSLVFGIIKFANNRYDDIYTFTVKLTGQKKDSFCGSFFARKKEELSFWLKVPDRRIENRDFQLGINISDREKSIDTSWKNDFKFGYWRNSSGQGQYYHLGTYVFETNFMGSLCYKTSGTWTAPYNGALVVRRKHPMEAPYKDIVFFFTGMLFITLGLEAIAKNKKYVI